MDLSIFESKKHADDGVDFPLVNTVTGEKVIGKDKKPVTFRVGHMDSARLRAAVNAKRRQREEAQKNAAPRAADVDDRVHDACEDIATMTTGWSDNFDLDGQPCAFSQEKAADVYYRFPEIFEQMARNAADRANFLLGLAKT